MASKIDDIWKWFINEMMPNIISDVMVLGGLKKLDDVKYLSPDAASAIQKHVKTHWMGLGKGDEINNWLANTILDSVDRVIISKFLSHQSISNQRWFRDLVGNIPEAKDAADCLTKLAALYKYTGNRVDVLSAPADEYNPADYDVIFLTALSEGLLKHEPSTFWQGLGSVMRRAEESWEQFKPTLQAATVEVTAQVTESRCRADEQQRLINERRARNRAGSSKLGSPVKWWKSRRWFDFF